MLACRREAHEIAARLGILAHAGRLSPVASRLDRDKCVVHVLFTCTDRRSAGSSTYTDGYLMAHVHPASDIHYTTHIYATTNLYLSTYVYTHAHVHAGAN